MNIQLVIIDGQNDFIENGAPLHVPGAIADTERLAKMIKDNSTKITKIKATLDSHHTNDVGHLWVWKDKTGNHPDPQPGIMVTSQDLISGNYLYVVPTLQNKMIQYAQELEAKNRYYLMIWADLEGSFICLKSFVIFLHLF